MFIGTNNICATISVLSVNLIITLVYVFIISDEKRKKLFFLLPKFFQKLFVVFFVLPLIISPPLSGEAVSSPGIMPGAIGVLLSLGGLILILSAFLKIGLIPSIKSESAIIISGAYGIVRHPIYSGTIILYSGLVVFFQSSIALCYLPLSVLLYYVMTIYEEKDLIVIYGDAYLEYRKKVRARLIPYVL